MLARTFKSAVELGITEVERDALIQVLYGIEDGTIPLNQVHMHDFHCGTQHCIAGWANYLEPDAFPEISQESLNTYVNNFGGVNPVSTLRTRVPVTLGCIFGLYSGSLKSANLAVKDLRQYLETGTTAP